MSASPMSPAAGAEAASQAEPAAGSPAALPAAPGRATPLTNALVLGGALLAALAAVQRYAHALDAPGARFVFERERCHGIVRAGRNDCGTSTHACAGQARGDGGAEEWISLPAGTCERIAGGRLRGGTGTGG